MKSKSLKKVYHQPTLKQFGLVKKVTQKNGAGGLQDHNGNHYANPIPS